MKVDKEILVIGDIEMGAGNLTDDFISDKTLAELISKFSKIRHPVDLILNGDTFDFFKCPYFDWNKLTYPRHITAEISQVKLRTIHHAHPKVFQALHGFVKTPKHNLYFIIGNHDFDLLYKEVQHDLKKILKGHTNVHFSWNYHYEGVYIEHGHQYDFLNKINFKRFFLSYKGKSILNLPWITFGLISNFMNVKEEHPFAERISNRNLLFSHHRPFLREVSFKAIGYMIKSIIYYPLRHYSDPTYTFPKELFRAFYRRIKKLQWDLDRIIPIFKTEKTKIFEENTIHILGHIHEKIVEEKDGKAIIHPGSWRDEYELDKHGKIHPQPKRYVQILLKGKSLTHKLIELPVKRKPLQFKEVMADERKSIQLAAREEGYEPVFY